MDSPRQTKKRKMDVCDSGFRAGPDENNQPAPDMADSDLGGDLDPESVCDRTKVIRAGLAGCLMTRQRMLAKCRSNVSTL